MGEDVQPLRGVGVVSVLPPPRGVAITIVFGIEILWCKENGMKVLILGRPISEKNQRNLGQISPSSPQLRTANDKGRFMCLDRVILLVSYQPSTPVGHRVN